jgi:hypothetical protein
MLGQVLPFRPEFTQASNHQGGMQHKEVETTLERVRHAVRSIKDRLPYEINETVVQPIRCDLKVGGARPSKKKAHPCSVGPILALVRRKLDFPPCGG